MQNARRRTLCQSLFTLTWLHSELALPPIPTSSPHNFPPHLLPPYSEEEQPGLYASYERLLHTIITLNPLPPMDDGNEEWPVVENLEGLKETEPEIPLIEWVEETMELWTSKKEEHEARIQELYNMVEPLWTKLGVEQETMDCFVEMNRGSGEATIKAVSCLCIYIYIYTDTRYNCSTKQNTNVFSNSAALPSHPSSSPPAPPSSPSKHPSSCPPAPNQPPSPRCTTKNTPKTSYTCTKNRSSGWKKKWKARRISCPK